MPSYLCLNFHLEPTMSPFVPKMLHLSIIFLTILGSVTAQSQNAYKNDVDQWHNTRVADLKAENGWLNIIGLHWLRPGKNTFGTGNGVAIRLPAGTVAPEAGYFELSDGTVTLQGAPGITFTVNGRTVQNAVIFHKDSARAPEVRFGDLKWNIIKRDDKFGVRVRHLKSAAIDNFKGIDRYTVDSSWRIIATLQPASIMGGISITNVLGQTTRQESPGKLAFSIGGKSYTLDALDGGKDELFIIFGDETNGVETYPSGRYVYVKRPGADGVVILDFNKAYNPPCAFTEYATCPLPPKQNVLPIAITAGEKNYGTHK